MSDTFGLVLFSGASCILLDTGSYDSMENAIRYYSKLIDKCADIKILDFTDYDLYELENNPLKLMEVVLSLVSKN